MGPVSAADGARGAYGLRLTGFADPSRLLVAADPSWPTLDIVQERSDAGRRRPEGLGVADLRWDDERAVMWLDDHDHLELDRAAMRLRLVTREPVGDQALAHPYVGLPAAVANHWLGRQVLHGGAVLVGGRAWGLLGTKEAGKSSTVAWLAGHGHPVLSDDLLVVEGATALCSGPRCVDLRPESAALLGGQEIQLLPTRRRWRVHLDQVDPVHPLGGLVHLDWGDALRVEPVRPTQALPMLFANTALGPNLADAVAYLDLAGLPTIRLVRPPGLDGLDAAGSLLVAALTELGA
jgi:hypothetical protein